MKLQTRFLIHLGLLGTLSIAVFSFIIRNEVVELQQTEINNRLEDHRTLADVYIDSVLSNLTTDLDLLSNDSLTRQYFSADEVIRYQLFHTELTRTIKRYLTHSSLYSEITIILPDGFKEIYVTDGQYRETDEDPRLASLPEDTIHQVNNVSFTVTDEGNNHYFLNAYTPITQLSKRLILDSENPIVSYLKIKIPLNRLIRSSSSNDVMSSFVWQGVDIVDTELSKQIGINFNQPTSFSTTEFSIFESFSLKVTLLKKNIQNESTELFRQSVILIVSSIISLVALTVALLKIVIIRPLRVFTSLVSRSSTENDNKGKLLAFKSNELSELSNQFNSLMSRLSASSGELERQAYTDTLTKLPNRAALYRLLEKHTQQSKQPISILFLDLDGFKQVNDIYGHKVGDLLLVEVAKKLLNIVRGGPDAGFETIEPRKDAVIRLGGDEFTIILMSNDHAEQISNRIIHAFQSGINVEGKMLYTGASIGISEYPKNSEEPTLLIQYADLAMYQAKNNGKMRYCRFTPELATQERKRLEIEETVREGIEFNRFEAYYQAKIDVRTDTIVGLEALARLRNSNGEMISPGLFIPMAQENGVLEYITYMVTEQTCQLLQKLNKPDLVASINISPSQLNDFRLLADIRTIMWRYNVLPKQIEFEITEEELITNFEATRNSLNLIRNFGFRTALDDFGSGYSSLGQLKKFQFDTLKLDRVFVSTEDYDTEASIGVLASIKSLADILGMSIVAEGIETKDQIEFIQSFGIDVIQGFYCARPVSSDDFQVFYQEKNK